MKKPDLHPCEWDKFILQGKFVIACSVDPTANFSISSILNQDLKLNWSDSLKLEQMMKSKPGIELT